MKSQALFALFSVLSLQAAAPAFAGDMPPAGGIGPEKIRELVCSSKLGKMGGQTTLRLAPSGASNDLNTYVLTGSTNGGIATYIAEIGPYTVDESPVAADVVDYSNRELGIDLRVVTTMFDGRLVITGVYGDGKTGEIAMSCGYQFAE